MTVLTKWVSALVCALLPIWLMVEHLSIEVAGPDNLSVPSIASMPVSKAEAEQQLAKGLLLWRDKQYQESAQVFSSLGTQNLNEDLQALTSLYQYHATAFNTHHHSDFMQQLSILPNDCKQKLLFVTADLESLPQAEYFRARFSKDPRLSSLSICIYDLTWFDPVDLVCEDNWQQGGRLGCQLLSLAEKLKSIPFTHLVIFAEKGKANVHNGIMFLDRKDTYDVFIHELAHFSGFIDEYPLSKELAKRVCAGVDAPNIVFKQAQQLQLDRQYWQSIGLQNSSDLYAARTCDNHTSQAFKASKKLTFMEYHDTAFIPANYLKAWQKQLQKMPNQPSAHVNFAQLYEQSNNLSESKFWRAKYQQYLKANTGKIKNL
ncbi:hypothetical protein [uncultured Paraglaciecola sp.]|uniref:hypothetical protein n=1 Tax=uncultured Paraglaciecola sp. TaxID=1765024 RepID=UPI0030D730EB|tara:strand:+ start:78921 stop:80042 length:1122 start_codon:yes stop_codon:yes gene_type:complete